jgi:hypothetical protein
VLQLLPVVRRCCRLALAAAVARLLLLLLLLLLRSCSCCGGRSCCVVGMRLQWGLLARCRVTAHVIIRIRVRSMWQGLGIWTLLLLLLAVLECLLLRCSSGPSSAPSAG